jgi:hypothetical protein
MGWWELAEITGDLSFRDAYQRILGRLLGDWRTFLWGNSEPSKTVDRLHAFLYFLEGMLPVATDAQCAAALCEAIRLVPYHQRRTAAARFERSDVYAQLLRIRLYADAAGVVPLDRAAAEREADILAAFQATSSDPRLDGGFYFGRQEGAWLPYVNPVSTAFGMQALALWDQYCNGGSPADWRLLI